jgi:hypothetical protein
MATAPAVKKKVRRRGFLRRAAGWVLLAAGLVLATLSVWMVWYHAMGFSGSGSTSVAVELRTGQLIVIMQQPGEKGTDGYIARERERWKAWEWVYDQSSAGHGWGGKGVVLVVTLWPFALAGLAGGGWLLWTDRRRRRHEAAGHCAVCGYSIAGLAGRPCPECGHSAR